MVRLISASMAASLIVTVIVRAAGDADRLDQVTIVALALLAVAGAFSMFPRLSFDAVLAATPVVAQRTDATLNPLNEGRRWGYRRMPIFWPASEPALPDPHAVSLRWVLAPQEAIAEAQLGAQLPACLPDTGSPGSP